MKATRTIGFIGRFLLVCLVLVVVIEGFIYFQPLPTIQPSITIKNLPASSALTLPWPNYGQAAIGAQGFGVLAIHGQQKPAPIASVAKIMTAYAVLKEKPLQAGQQGPLITITSQDVNVYNDYYAKGGSVARVAAGEQISEYQALQAMLLPSANNFADLLANWAFGSLDNYIIYANGQAQQLGLSATHITDASGFSPQTLSSAQDLVKLGEQAIKNPVIADVASQQQATIPVAGTVRNINWLLGVDNVNGIKTGDTDQAGGCFLFSARHAVDGQNITIIGAIMSAPGLNNAVADSRPLINSAGQGFKTIAAVKAGQAVGYYNVPWGGQVLVAAKQDLSLLIWQGQAVHIATKLNPIHVPSSENETVGTITVSAGGKLAAIQAILSQKINNPPLNWRLFER